MNHTKCIKIDDIRFQRLKEQFKSHLNISEIQTYFPILALFFEFYNESNTSFVLNSKFLVDSLKENIQVKKTDSYIKNFFKAEILDQSNNEVFEKDLFIKILPLLNISQSMMNDYNLKNTHGLPNIFSCQASKKINNHNNSAYIDSFFSYLASKLVENGKCPTFPLFFGTFTGITNEFMYDITEEYNSIKKTSWFKKNLNNKFKMINIDLEDNKSISSEKDINIDSIELDNLELDNLELDDLELVSTTNLIDSTEQLSEEPSGEEEEARGGEEEEARGDEEEEEPSGDEEEEEPSGEEEEEEPSGEEEEEARGGEEEEEPSGEEEEEPSGEEEEEVTEHSAEEESVENKSEILNLENIRDELNNNEIFNKIMPKLDFLKNSELDNISVSSDNISLSSGDMFDINYCCFNDYPVQLNCIEMLEKTLDNYIEETSNNIPEIEWISILFQVCFGLAVAQKNFDFVHNDLHSSNIMFKSTELEYLYFNFKGTYFKIPTFGKISKIIDFGRATFNYKNKLFFSDVFKKNGEAEGQYSYPYLNSLKICRIKPNKSFDLCRLATTIIDHFEEDSDLYKLMKLWASDKYGNFLMELEDDFNLYRIIAKNVKSAIPKNQINKLIFKQFIVDKEDIKNEYIYNY